MQEEHCQGLDSSVPSATPTHSDKPTLPQLHPITHHHGCMQDLTAVIRHPEKAQKEQLRGRNEESEREELLEELAKKQEMVCRLEKMLQDKEENDVGFYMVTNRLKDRLELVEAEGKHKEKELNELTRRLEEKHGQLMEARERVEALKVEVRLY